MRRELIRSAKVTSPGIIAHGPEMKNLRHDVLLGLRLLRIRRTFTIVAVLVLTLGIGSTTAVFSIVNAVVFAPLPYSEPDRLAFLAGSPVSVSLFKELHEECESFDDIAAFASRRFFVDSPDGPKLYAGMRVSSSFFEVLGVASAIGRTFHPEEDQLGPPAAVLSHEIWTDVFGGDPNVVDKLLRVGNESYVVLGVMPQGFHFSRRGMLTPPFGSPSSLVKKRLREKLGFSTWSADSGAAFRPRPRKLRFQQSRPARANKGLIRMRRFE